MSEFLVRAACRGHRPYHAAFQRHTARPALIARLLRERHVARFIVAPDGFGKTDLAIQYADVVFSFQHVFWIDGSSPCFLRDLDNACIAQTLTAQDPETFLAVFEDVPPLDCERAEQFSEEIDAMLDLGCEVLITCLPTCDAFERHCDRITLGAYDLLLSDEELEDLSVAGEYLEKPPSYLLPAQRVVGLLPLAQTSHKTFLVRALREELPSDVLLPLFSLLILQTGSFKDLFEAKLCSLGELQFLAKHYPYLGIDLQNECFETVAFTPDDLASAFSAKLDTLVAQSQDFDRNTLVTKVADMLLDQRCGQRACEIVVLLASRPTRASWLASCGERLLSMICLLPACEVYHSLAGQLDKYAIRLDTDESVRRALLGDSPAACMAARRVMGNNLAPARDRIVSAFILVFCGSEDERCRAQDFIAKQVPDPSSNESEGTQDLAPVKLLSSRFDELTSISSDVPSDEWTVVGTIFRALKLSCVDAASTWIDWYERGLYTNFLVYISAYILRRATYKAQHDEEQMLQTHPPAIERLAHLVRERLVTHESPLELCDAVAGISLERACEYGVVNVASLDAKTASVLRRIELSLFSQRNDCDRLEHERSGHSHSSLTLPSHTGYPSSALSEGMVGIPTLTVNLFGGLDVRIGEEIVDPMRFRRQKVKTLLALLVLNRGREFSRDRLVSMLWPESDLISARKNFYGTWSILRHALSTKSGSCPYLIRQQQGLRLDANLLTTDVTQLEEILRILLFERPGYGGWAHVLEQINERFSDDLMPSESENSVIAGLRIDYRNRLVDALVSASNRLERAGDVQEALWFARAALNRDHTREDVYAALMRAQMAAGQRTAALDTYFSCRHVLVEELGIDPSPEIVSLYRAIIETEEVFV